jgi:hypothetical protein|tara:strand:- start:345 stop:515 length:171 start_codon:yes stop_codon:yes gene_type:complete
MEKIWKVFNYKDKLDFIKLIILTFVATLLEAVSVALVFPIITIIFQATFQVLKIIL